MKKQNKKDNFIKADIEKYLDDHDITYFFNDRLKILYVRKMGYESNVPYWELEGAVDPIISINTHLENSNRNIEWITEKVYNWGEWQEETYLQYNYPLWNLHERDYEKYKRINNIEDFLAEENIKHASNVSSEINRLKDIDEVGMLQIDFLQIPGTGSEYIQIDHDLRTLKNSLNNCIRRINLLTKEIRGVNNDK